MRGLLVLALWSLAQPVLAQSVPEQVVTPTYLHERTCTQMVPCDGPLPPCPFAAPAPAPCTPPVIVPVIHYEMRSKPLFWTGAALVGAGAAFAIGSMTWAQESAIVGYPTAPCGTDPILTRLAIAPCQVSHNLLAAGVATVGVGVGLMIYGGERVAVNADGRQVTVRVRF